MAEDEFRFEACSCEEAGIPSEAVRRFLERLDSGKIPLHGFLLLRDGKLCFENYVKPYGRTRLHRMFSVTKNFVSLAVGLLEEEGKIRLDDRACSFFSDRFKPEELHPYIRRTTVRDLLRMTGPHSRSAYKMMDDPDWIRCFFLCPPSHMPGTAFAYDTSATHVLTAIVEKLTGKSLLLYLREKFLDRLGISEETYIIRDAYGVSLGGSGLMMTPYDLAKVMLLISRSGEWNGRQLLPAGYVREATSFQADNAGKPGTQALEETQGYGYLFWLVRHGFACFGMGGQLAVCLPEKNIIFVTTADTQDIPGGVQQIYDAFYDCIWPFAGAPLCGNPGEENALKSYAASRTLPVMECTAEKDETLSDGWYVLDANPSGFEEIRLVFRETDEGSLEWKKNGEIRILPFGIGKQCESRFPDGGYACSSSGAYRKNHQFILKSWLVGENIGSVTFLLAFREESVTLLIHKAEETELKDYEVMVSGHRK